MKRKSVLFGIGIVISALVLCWYFYEASKINPYIAPVRNDFCESVDDCALIESECDSCSCDLRAVSKAYYNYWHNDLCDSQVRCDAFCERTEIDCVNHRCIITGDSGIDFCEVDGDCLVENMDYTSCSCDMMAVNLGYADYMARERARVDAPSDCHELSCELQLAKCVGNRCVIDG